MPTLNDLLNAPADLEFEGVTYSLRQPTLLEAFTYSRWLEQEARAGAARATELADEDRRNLLRDVQADIAAQRYAWGGELCVQSLSTPPGIAKLLSIVCAAQGLTAALALRVVEHRLREVAALLVGELEEDPSGNRLRGLLASLGLSPNFFGSSSSASPTAPTGGTSARSEASASASSSPSS